MRKLLLLILLGCFGAIQAQDTSIKLYYSLNQSSLQAVQKQQLDSLVSQLDSSLIERIHIAGHTDHYGTETYNLQLSEQRAIGVMKYLIEQGLNKDVLESAFYGEQQPDSTVNNSALNRRVELFVKLKEVVKNDLPQTTIKDLYSRLASLPQEFTIDPKRDTVLRCQQGSIIHIKANSFKTARSTIRFQVKEVFSKSAMVIENLTTMAGERILSSQGMIFTNAMSANDTLALQKDLTILMPSDTVRADIRVFDGARSTSSGIMNWELANDSLPQSLGVKEADECFLSTALLSECYSNDTARFSIVGSNPMAICTAGLMECLRLDCEDEEIDPFFFKRVKRVFKPIQGTLNKDWKDYNQAYRECQRNLRAARKVEQRIEKNNGWLTAVDLQEIRKELIPQNVWDGIKPATDREREVLAILKAMQKVNNRISIGGMDKTALNNCKELQNIFEEFGVKNLNDLIFAINEPLLKQAETRTIEELKSILEQTNLDDVEAPMQSKKMAFSKLKYYVFPASQTGWKNLDYYNQEDIPFVKFKVKEEPSALTDCILVLEASAALIPAEAKTYNYLYKRVPAGEKAWLVGLKYEHGQSALALHAIDISKQNQTLEFKEMSLEELREALKVLE